MIRFYDKIKWAGDKNTIQVQNNVDHGRQNFDDFFDSFTKIVEIARDVTNFNVDFLNMALSYRVNDEIVKNGLGSVLLEGFVLGREVGTNKFETLKFTESLKHEQLPLNQKTFDHIVKHFT